MLYRDDRPTSGRSVVEVETLAWRARNRWQPSKYQRLFVFSPALRLYDGAFCFDRLPANVVRVFPFFLNSRCFERANRLPLTSFELRATINANCLLKE